MAPSSAAASIVRSWRHPDAAPADGSPSRDRRRLSGAAPRHRTADGRGPAGPRACRSEEPAAKSRASAPPQLGLLDAQIPREVEPLKERLDDLKAIAPQQFEVLAVGGAAAAAACLFLGNVLSPTSNENRLARWHSPLALPVRYGNVAGALSGAGVLLAVGAGAGAVAGLVIRWRRGGPLVRQQLLLLALATWPPALVFLAILITNGAPGWIFGVVLLAPPGRDRDRDLAPRPV